MKSQKHAVEIKNIHKDFVLPQSKNTSLKQAAVNIIKKNNSVTQRVLDGVSFTIEKGDFFGVVGRNGSGKSTLLKLIAGVYTPTSGSIDIYGGLTPFIELGVGFNPELSGHDNVYLNGALLGFTRKQVDEMYDDIVEFAELGPFMDQKLKNYSSGMQVRLAFSIAIKAKNDILIFDEVLAVGDEAFQRKCLDVFERYKAEKQTVILVTHDMGVVRRFCTKAALISEGKVLMCGDQRRVADYYSRLNQEAINKEEDARQSRLLRKASLIKEAKVSTASGSITSLKSGGQLRLTATLENDPRIHKVIVSLYKNSGEYIIGLRAPDAAVKKHEITLDLSPRLGKGRHHFTLELYDKKGNLCEDIYRTENITVVDDQIPSFGTWSGLIAVDHKWGQ